MLSSERRERQRAGFRAEFRISPTDSTLNAMNIAGREATSYGRSSIESEHILLGVASVPEIQSTLPSIGLNQKIVRSATEFIIGEGDRTVRTRVTDLSRSAREAISLSRREALRLEDEDVQLKPIHLLLGLIRGEGIAAGVLASIGIDYESVFRKIVNDRINQLRSLR